MNASPSKFRFPEAGLRVMVTSHFGPKTRLRMASRLIITEVQLPVVAWVRGFSCCCDYKGLWLCFWWTKLQQTVRTVCSSCSRWAPTTSQLVLLWEALLSVTLWFSSVCILLLGHASYCICLVELHFNKGFLGKILTQMRIGLMHVLTVCRMKCI